MFSNLWEECPVIPEKPVSALFKRISISLELTSDLENCHINNLSYSLNG